MSLEKGMPQSENELKKEKLPGRVYCVECPDDRTVVFAMDVMIEGKTIRWFDGTKERIMYVKEIVDKNTEHFVFRRADGTGGEYAFSPMTLDVYNKKVRSNLLSAKDFDDEEKMLKAFESLKKTAW